MGQRHSDGAPGGTTGGAWAAVPLDAVVLTLSLLAALGRPTDARATLVAVAATFLLGVYWVVTLLARDHRRTFVVRLGVILALMGLVVVLPAMPAAGAGDAVGRYLNLLALCALIGLSMALGTSPRARLMLVAGLGLNPFFVPTFAAGEHLAVTLAAVLAAIWLAHAGLRRPALLAVGAALALDTRLLPMLPFLLLWMAGRESARDGDGQGLSSIRQLSTLPERVRQLGPSAPFYDRFVRNCLAGAYVARALGWVVLPVIGAAIVTRLPGLRDLLSRAPLGAAHGGHAVAYGLANLVIAVHGSAGAGAWSLTLLQAVVAVSLMLALLRRQWRDNTLARAVAGCATTIFVAGYCGPSFGGTAIALTLALALLALCLDRANCTHLSRDFLVLLLVVPQSLAAPVTPTLAVVAALVMGLLVLYALVDAYADGWLNDAAGRLAGRNWRLRLGLMLALLGLVVIWPELFGILARHAAHPWNYVHDVAMQVEEAMKFLVAGKDYYAQTYLRTPMVHWYSSPAMAAALYHTDRTPFGIVGSLPFYLLSRATLGWYDQRFVYLPCLALCIALIVRLPTSRELRVAALAAVLLNPFFVPTLIYGEDDVLVLALLLLCGGALYRGRYRQAALWLGLACATKHTALFMLPPFLAFALARHRASGGWTPRLAAVWREAWPALLVPALICAPFLAWNARAFLDGNVGFLAGTVPHSYPIRGVGTYGFSALVLLGGLVRSPAAYYPFTLWEAAAALPLVAVPAIRLWRRPCVRDLFATYALLLFACYFFSRFFQDSGLGYATSALLLAALSVVDRK